MSDQSYKVETVLQKMQSCLACTICLDLLTNPLTTKCGHTFCRECLDRLLKGAKSSAFCPLCVTSITRRSAKQNKKISDLVSAVHNVIKSIKEDCGFQESNKVKDFSSEADSISYKDPVDNPLKRVTRQKGPATFFADCLPAKRKGKYQGLSRETDHVITVENNSGLQKNSSLEPVNHGQVPTVKIPEPAMQIQKVEEWLKIQTQFEEDKNNDDDDNLQATQMFQLNCEEFKRENVTSGNVIGSSSLSHDLKDDDFPSQATTVIFNIDDVKKQAKNELNRLENVSDNKSVLVSEEETHSVMSEKENEKQCFATEPSIKRRNSKRILFESNKVADLKKGIGRSTNTSSANKFNELVEKLEETQTVLEECLKSNPDESAITTAESGENMSKTCDLIFENKQPNKKGHNIRFAYDVKSKLLETSKPSKLTTQSKTKKSPGWSRIEGARRDLRSRHTSLDIKGGDIRPNLSESKFDSFKVIDNCSQESVIVIDNPSQVDISSTKEDKKFLKRQRPGTCPNKKLKTNSVSFDATAARSEENSSTDDRRDRGNSDIILTESFNDNGFKAAIRNINSSTSKVGSVDSGFPGDSKTPNPVVVKGLPGDSKMPSPAVDLTQSKVKPFSDKKLLPNNTQVEHIEESSAIEKPESSIKFTTAEQSEPLARKGKLSKRNLRLKTPVVVSLNSKIVEKVENVSGATEINFCSVNQNDNLNITGVEEKSVKKVESDKSFESSQFSSIKANYSVPEDCVQAKEKFIKKTETEKIVESNHVPSTKSSCLVTEGCSRNKDIEEKSLTTNENLPDKMVHFLYKGGLKPKRCSNSVGKNELESKSVNFKKISSKEAETNTESVVLDSFGTTEKEVAVILPDQIDDTTLKFKDVDKDFVADNDTDKVLHTNDQNCLNSKSETLSNKLNLDKDNACSQESNMSSSVLSNKRSNCNISNGDEEVINMNCSQNGDAIFSEDRNSNKTGENAKKHLSLPLGENIEKNSLKNVSYNLQTSLRNVEKLTGSQNSPLSNSGKHNNNTNNKRYPDSSYNRNSLNSSESPITKKQIKRTQRLDSSSSEDDSDIVCPKKRNRLSTIDSTSPSPQKRNLISSEELRDFERYDQNIWNYYASKQAEIQNKTKNVAVESYANGRRGNLKESQITDILDDGQSDGDLKEGQVIDILDDDGRSDNDLKEGQVIDVLDDDDDNQSEDDDLIPGTEEVIKNVELDLARIREMREKNSREITSETESQPVNLDEFSQTSVMTTSTTNEMNASTRELFNKCNLSLNLAQKILDAPEDCEEEEFVKSPSVNDDFLEKEDSLKNTENDDTVNNSHSSMLSTESPIISTQQRNKVQTEVEVLKSKIMALEAEMNEKQASLNETDNLKMKDDTSKRSSPSGHIVELKENQDQSKDFEKESDLESEELFQTFPTQGDLNHSGITLRSGRNKFSSTQTHKSLLPTRCGVGVRSAHRNEEKKRRTKRWQVAEVPQSQYTQYPPSTPSQAKNSATPKTSISATHRFIQKEEKPPTLICTGLNSSEIATVRAFGSTLCGPEAKVVSKWCNEITHVIVKTDEEGMTERTLKYLFGVASRAWIVSIQWISDSMASNVLLPEDEYEALDCTGAPGPRKGRRISVPIFNDCQFCLVPPFNDVTIDQLNELVQLCGGTVVKKFNEEKKGLKLIIVNSEDFETEGNESYGQMQRCKVTVAHDWLIECVGMCSLVSLQNYIVGTPSLEEIAQSGVPESLLYETQELV